MSYLVLARKWRPQIFEEIIGQRHITQTLKNAIISDRLAHAYIFSGVRGVGKTTTARILAKALNCETGPTPTPCNKCNACTEITSGISMDVIEIDGASNRGIDDIRDLRENVKYAPSKSRYKIFIIDEVHMLTREAFNALLKTLEEPPPHVKFIFATTEPYKIPMTIQSRCQLFNFRRISIREIINQLEFITREEGIKISEQSLSIVAKAAEGSMRDAQSLLDQIISSCGKNVKDEDVVSLLGLVNQELLTAMSSAIINKDANKSITLLDELIKSGHDIYYFCSELLKYFRDLIIIKTCHKPEDLIELSSEGIDTLKGSIEKISIEELQQLFKILSEAEEEIRRSSHPKIIFEIALVKMSKVEPIQTLNEIIQKLTELEDRLMGNAGNTQYAHSQENVKINSLPSTKIVPKQKSNIDNKSTAHLKISDITYPYEVEEKSKRDLNKIWQEIVKNVQDTKISLGSFLEHSSLVNLTDTELIINLNNHSSMFIESINETENKKILKKKVKEYFNKAMDVKITTLPKDEILSENLKREGDSDKNRRLRKEALEKPIVQEALEMFKGEIINIKVNQNLQFNNNGGTNQ